MVSSAKKRPAYVKISVTMQRWWSCSKASVNASVGDRSGVAFTMRKFEQADAGDECATGTLAEIIGTGYTATLHPASKMTEPLP